MGKIKDGTLSRGERKKTIGDFFRGFQDEDIHVINIAQFYVDEEGVGTEKDGLKISSRYNYMPAGEGGSITKETILDRFHIFDNAGFLKENSEVIRQQIPVLSDIAKGRIGDEGIKKMEKVLGIAINPEELGAILTGKKKKYMPYITKGFRKTALEEFGLLAYDLKPVEREEKSHVLMIGDVERLTGYNDITVSRDILYKSNNDLERWLESRYKNTMLNRHGYIDYGIECFERNRRVLKGNDYESDLIQLPGDNGD